MKRPAEEWSAVESARDALVRAEAAVAEARLRYGSAKNAMLLAEEFCDHARRRHSAAWAGATAAENAKKSEKAGQ